MHHLFLYGMCYFAIYTFPLGEQMNDVYNKAVRRSPSDLVDAFHGEEP